MSNIFYCGSEDQLGWYIPAQMRKEYVRMSNDELGTNRFLIHQWIKEHCKEDVILWNETCRPSIGDAAWGNKIYPQGDIRFYFLDPADGTMFILRWMKNETT